MDISEIDYNNIEDIKTLIKKLEFAIIESKKFQKQMAEEEEYLKAYEEDIYQEDYSWFIGLLKQIKSL